MKPSSRTPEGSPNRCPLCGKVVVLESSEPFGDAPCPHCGHLLWFFRRNQSFLFFDSGVIDDLQIEKAVGMAKSLGISAEDALVKLEYVFDSPKELFPESREFGSMIVELTEIEIPQSILDLVPESVAREHEIVPIRFEDSAIVVAISDPMNFEILDKLRFILNKEIRVATAAAAGIRDAIEKNYR